MTETRARPRYRPRHRLARPRRPREQGFPSAGSAPPAPGEASAGAACGPPWPAPPSARCAPLGRRAGAWWPRSRSASPSG